jgi:hypothetical protein
VRRLLHAVEDAAEVGDLIGAVAGAGKTIKTVIGSILVRRRGRRRSAAPEALNSELGRRRKVRKTLVWQQDAAQEDKLGNPIGWRRSTGVALDAHKKVGDGRRRRKSVQKTFGVLEIDGDRQVCRHWLAKRSQIKKWMTATPLTSVPGFLVLHNVNNSLIVIFYCTCKGITIVCSAIVTKIAEIER